MLRDKKLIDMSKRVYYQTALGKKISWKQWENIRETIIEEFPEEGLSEEILDIIAELKKASPYWKIKVDDVFDLLEIKNSLSSGKNVISGAEIFLKAKKLCRYKVSERTIRQWFYNSCNRCDLHSNYTYIESLGVLTRAITSKPRAFKK